ncbi:hypothetical protein PG988_001679 [Apiospora saccharicola]
MFIQYPIIRDDYYCPGIEKCNIARIINRKPRNKIYPRIYYGTIGLLNIAIKSTNGRDELRDSIGVLYIEIKAAGLIKAFPYLVIRGISDYTDSYKNAAW